MCAGQHFGVFDLYHQAVGVKPSTMSNRAASSPMRDSLIGAKSTMTELRA